MGTRQPRSGAGVAGEAGQPPATLGVAEALRRGPFPGFSERIVWSGMALHRYRRRAVPAEATWANPTHLVLVVRSGWGRLHCAGRSGSEALLVPGRVLFVRAGSKGYQTGTLPDCLTLSVVPDGAASDGHHATPNRSIDLRPDAFCEQFGSILAAAGSGDGPLDLAFAAAMRRALLMHLERRLSEPPPVRDAGLSDARLAAVLDFIDLRIGKPISLDSLARIAGVGRFHFARSFKAALGVSPMTLVERARIDAAKALLARGPVAIAEVAASVGFADQSHFTRRFHRHTGTTPAAFARQAGLRAAPKT